MFKWNKCPILEPKETIKKTIKPLIYCILILMAHKLNVVWYAFIIKMKYRGYQNVKKNYRLLLLLEFKV